VHPAYQGREAGYQAHKYGYRQFLGVGLAR